MNLKISTLINNLKISASAHFQISALVIFFLLSMSLGNLFAQKTLDSMLIINIGEYKPTIMSASKMNANPTIIDSTKTLPVSAYSINSKKINTNFAVEPIKPAVMVGEPLTKLYNSYVKLGMGTYTTPYGELWINNLRSKDVSTGIRIKHLSSTYIPKDGRYAGFSDDEISLSGKKMLKDHSLIGNFDYARNLVHLLYGGYGDDAKIYSLKKDTTAQLFNLFSGNAEFKSQYSNAKRLNHDVKLNYYNLSGPLNSSENNIKATGMVQTAIGKQQIKINALVDYYNYKTVKDTVDKALKDYYKTVKDTVNNTIITLNPNYIAKGEKYSANLGFATTMDVFEKSKLYIYPNIDFSYNVFENIIIPYVGATGGLQKNSYKTLKDANPLVRSELQMQNSSTYEMFGGIRGTLSATTSFNARVSYNNINNMAMFVNDTTGLQNKFIVIYDNAKVLNITGEVAYQMREKLRINLRGEYYSYTMQTQSRAWYKPQAKLTLSGNYNLRDKIVVKVDLFYLDNQYAKTSDALVSGKIGEYKKLREVFNANIGAEYRYTKNLGFFFNFNNIANYQYYYYRWSNYPTQRFSLMAGLSYSF